MFILSYFKSLVISFVIFCLLFAGAVQTQVGAPTESSRVRHETYLVKSELVERYSQNHNKFIIVSGSNGLQGLSCDLIRQQLSINCVNAATTVVLGVDYILYKAREWLQPGDVVLLPLEYEYFLYEGIPNEELVDYTFARDYTYFKWADWQTKLRLLGGVTFPRLWQGLNLRHQKPTFDLDYRASIMNNYGDTLQNIEAKMKPAAIARRDNMQPLDSLLTSDYVSKSKGLDIIKRFVEDCRQKDVTVLATWPNTIRFDVYQTPNTQAFFKSIADFYQYIDVPMVGTSDEAMFDISLFFNSRYHLHDRGVSIRTEAFIENLRPYIEKTSQLRL